SPNREVGDRSFRPATDGLLRGLRIPQPGGWGSFIPAYNGRLAPGAPNPPTGRLGIVHSCLQRTACSGAPNPPTRRLGIVHSCLQRTACSGAPNPPTGRLGSFILA